MRRPRSTCSGSSATGCVRTRAEASAAGDKARLFLELRGAGYPGSTYELLHDPRGDFLAGVYFQAALGQSFDVVFVRKK